MQLPQTAVIDFHNYISNIMYNIVSSFIEVIMSQQHWYWKYTRQHKQFARMDNQDKLATLYA